MIKEELYGKSKKFALLEKKVRKVWLFEFILLLLLYEHDKIPIIVYHKPRKRIYT